MSVVSNYYSSNMHSFFLFNEGTIRNDRVNGYIKIYGFIKKYELIKKSGFNKIYGDSRFPYRESKSLFSRPHKALDYFHSGCRLTMVSCVIPKPASASLIDCSIRSFFSDLSIFYFFFYSR